MLISLYLPYCKDVKMNLQSFSPINRNILEYFSMSLYMFHCNFLINLLKTFNTKCYVVNLYNTYQFQRIGRRYTRTELTDRQVNRIQRHFSTLLKNDKINALLCKKDLLHKINLKFILNYLKIKQVPEKCYFLFLLKT